MFPFILILRIISFPVSILSILMFIGSLYNSIGLTGGVYGGDFITYIFVFMIPLFGMWGIFHFIYFDNYIKESNHRYEGLKRFIDDFYGPPEVDRPIKPVASVRLPIAVEGNLLEKIKDPKFLKREIIDKLEKKLDTAVLSSNQALIWDTLVKINKNNSVEGFGKLFQAN